MTDVTGFGLGGHLREVCRASQVRAEINFSAIPLLPQTSHYLNMGCSPGGAQRNFDSYGHDFSPLSPEQRAIVCDPQTSGGLLMSVRPQALDTFHACCIENGLQLKSIGRLYPAEHAKPLINVR